jgi:hypothetical protein
MAATLREAGCVGSKVDPDVWMRPAMKKCGMKYWEYVLIYTDDILCISEFPKQTMDFLDSKYTLKAGTVKEPESYLGARILKCWIGGADDPDKTRWAMSSAIIDVKTEFEKVGNRLPTKVSTPLTAGYCAELDQSLELCKASHILSRIGWRFEVDR